MNLDLPPSAEPYVIDATRFERMRAQYMPVDGPERPFVGLCPACGLPAHHCRPCSRGRSWTHRCRACGARGFVAHPRQLFALTELPRQPLDKGLTHLVAFLGGLGRTGAQYLDRHGWERGLIGRREVIQLPVSQACLSCGEPASVAVRLDKHGRPYGVCASCAARTFWRHEHGLHVALGWTVWRRTELSEAAWWGAFQSGQTRWMGWFGSARSVGEARRSDEDEANREEVQQ